MFIKFRELQIDNFMSFGHAEVNLDRGGYVLVSGLNENPVDHATSNGSGKSALFDALIWCLTGTTSRETKNVSNINASNGAKVTLFFDVDENSYEVTRTKDYRPLGTTLKVIYNGADVSGKGIRDTEKILCEYLPDINASFLGSVIILGQGLPQRFSNNTPSGRKEVLEGLSKSDFMINELNDKVSKRRSTLSNNLDEVKHNISYLVGQQKVREESLTSVQREVEELKEFKLDAKSYLNDCLEARNSTKHKYEDIQCQLDRCQEEAYEADKQYQKVKSTISEIRTNKLLKENDIRSEFDTSISQLNFEISQIEKEILKLSAISDVCPTCGQKLLGVEKPDVIPLKNELYKKNQFKNEIVTEKQEKLASLKESNSKEEAELQENQERCASVLSDYTNRLCQLKSEVANSQSQYINAERVYNEAVVKINNLDNSISQKESTITQLNSCLQDLNDKILYNTDEQRNLESRLLVINKMVTALKRDFRGYLLTNVINYISDRTKYYSLQVFGNDNIGFSLVGNAIEISFDDKEYSNLSGGEKQRVDLIVQLSIRDMLCCFMNFSSNIIVLDEFVDGLDSIGCEEILNLISKNLSDVGTIYIITHHSSVAIPTDDEIIIVKDANKISSVR